MRLRLALCALPLALLVLLGACGDPDAPGAGPDGAGGSAEDPLAGRTFLGEGISVDGELVEVPSEERLEVSFRREGRGPGSVSARAACNHLGATYTIRDETLVTASTGSTDMGCDPARHEFDDLVVELLDGSPRFELRGDELTLRSDARGRRLEATLLDAEVADPAPPLEGTVWTLDSLIEGDAVSSVPGLMPVTLTLDGGEVTVDTGCNGLVGTYELAGDSLTITTDVQSPESCGPELDRIESAIVEVLNGDLSVEQDRRSLTLLSDDGTGLGFRAPD